MRLEVLHTVIISTLLVQLSLAAPATSHSPMVTASAANANPTSADNTSADGVTQCSGAFDVTGARKAITRLVGHDVPALTLTAVTTKDGKDFFNIQTSASCGVEIQGTSNAVILTGFDWYLKYVAKQDISWESSNVNLGDTLPLPSAPIQQHASSKHRIYGNDITTDYTSAHWTFAEWEHELDIMALKGYNTVFMTIGQEEVAHQLFQEFGYSRQEMLDWTPPPGHMAAGMWQGGWTIADGGSTEAAQTKRLETGQAIVKRMAELGLTPLMPGFVGFVPDGFAQKNGNASVINRGMWFSQKMLDWLDPQTPLYQTVAKRFYEIQDKLFGKSTLYAMNPFTEGGVVGVPLDLAGEGVQQALQASRPGAIWEMHAWQDNPKGTLLEKLDKNHTLVVAFNADRYTMPDPETDWSQTPYAFGGVWNFGGHTTMGGNLGVWVERYFSLLKKSGSKLVGIALSPEGGHGDILPLEFFGELGWRSGAFDVKQWFTDYATRRYGAEDAHASNAWQIMQSTAYNTPAGEWDEPQDSLFYARPSLTVNTAAAWSPESMRYDAANFARALNELLQVDGKLRNSANYKLDLVTVARQVLDNNARTMLPKLNRSATTKSSSLANQTAEFISQIQLVEDLVASIPGYKLGTWVEDARAAAGSDEEKQKYVRDAKEVLTLWGDQQLAESGLHDYCNRAWSGLIGGFYKMRWTTFFDKLAANNNDPSTMPKIDWYTLERAWVNNDTQIFPTEPSGGDTYALAQQAWQAKLRVDSWA